MASYFVFSSHILSVLHLSPSEKSYFRDYVHCFLSQKCSPMVINLVQVSNRGGEHTAYKNLVAYCYFPCLTLLTRLEGAHGNLNSTT